jgi:HK97 family phage portal protein
MFAPQAAITSEDIRRELGLGGYGVSNSGMTITPQTAMCVSAFFACVLVISQTAGKLPLIMYQKTPGGERPATDHPLYHLVGTKPNSFNNSQSFREMLTAHTCLRGNSFAFINRVGNGEIYELLPLEPSTVGVYRDPWTWEVTYQVSQKKGINGIYTPREIFHLMDMTLNGYQGLNRISYARETVGLAGAAERHGALSFKQGAKSSGVYNTLKKLDDAAFDALRSRLNEGFSGENAYKAMILEGTDTWTPSQMSNDDLQYMELRQFQIPEIARFFNMPLHKIQDMSASTNNNIEQMALEFYTDCMMPWLTRWESSLNTQLLPIKQQKEFFWKHDVDEILRADMKSRFEAYASGISSEILNPNECREWENLNPYVGGEIYLNRNTKPAPPAGGPSEKIPVV